MSPARKDQRQRWPADRRRGHRHRNQRKQSDRPIFESLPRADASTTRKYGGTGLDWRYAANSWSDGRRDPRRQRHQSRLVLGSSRSDGGAGGPHAARGLSLRRIRVAAVRRSADKGPDPERNSPRASLLVNGRRPRILVRRDPMQATSASPRPASPPFGLFVPPRTDCRGDVVDNGKEAIKSWRASLRPRSLLDCQMPEMDRLPRRPPLSPTRRRGATHADHRDHGQTPWKVGGGGGGGGGEKPRKTASTCRHGRPYLQRAAMRIYARTLDSASFHSNRGGRPGACEGANDGATAAISSPCDDPEFLRSIVSLFL